MISFALLVSASMIHSLELGLARVRGAITITAAVAALAVASVTAIVWRSYGNAGGAAAATALVLACRRIGRWLNYEGGWTVVRLVTTEATIAVASWLAAVTVAFVRGLLSPTRPTPVPVSVDDTPEPVPAPRDTAQVTLPHGDRWGLLTPAPEVADTSGDTGLAPVLHLAPAPLTYADWLATAVQEHGGFNAAAREAETRWGRSRSSFARDLRALKGEAA